MMPWLLLPVLLAIVWLLRVCFVRRATITVQAETITELKRDLERERAQNKNRFRPAELPAWVTEDSDGPVLVQGRPKMLALPPVIDLPRDAAHTAQQPVVGGTRNNRSRVSAGPIPSYGGQD